MSNSASSEALFQKIVNLDNLAFEAYNSCNLSEFKNYFVEDLEFYHDKSGLICSRSVMIQALEAILCNSGVKIRRELIRSSLRVYPIDNYGAIQVGEHYYYQSNKGQPEKLFEAAKFTHIWKNEGDQWRISRVLSYDHHPVADNQK